MATLTLRPAASTYSFVDGNVTRYPESHFLDFVIDGTSLRTLVAEAEDMVTMLNAAWRDVVVHESILVLLGRLPEPGLPSGRVPLLVCKVDGDIPCGAVTAELDIGATEVTWSALRWDNGYEEPEPATLPVEQFSFDRPQYEGAFADAYDRVTSFPYDKPAHEGRRFLWPWQWGWKMPPKEQP